MSPKIVIASGWLPLTFRIVLEACLHVNRWPSAPGGSLEQAWMSGDGSAREAVSTGKKISVLHFARSGSVAGSVT